MASVALLAPALVAVLVVALVAAVVPRRTAPAAGDVGTEPGALLRARRHAGVVGVLAWVALLAVPLVVSANAPAGLAGGVALGLTPAAGGLAAAVVTAVGERTWPRPAGTVRRASLQPRTVRDVAPRTPLVALATWTAALLLVLLATGLSAADDGRSITLDHAPLPVSGSAGPYPGGFYGIPVCVGTLLVAAAAVAVLHLVAHRPVVPGLSPADDTALRRASARRAVTAAQTVVGLTLAAVLALAGTALRNVARSSFAVDDVWTHVTDPLHLALGTTALVVAGAVLLATLALATAPAARGRLAPVPA